MLVVDEVKSTVETDNEVVCVPNELVAVTVLMLLLGNEDIVCVGLEHRGEEVTVADRVGVT